MTSRAAAAYDTGNWAVVTTIATACEKVKRAARRMDKATESLSAARLRAKLNSRSISSNPPADSNPDAASDEVRIAGYGKVLIVEDDVETARSAMRMFERSGFLVALVYSAAEAETKLAEPWECVVIDLNLGSGKSGLDVAERALQFKARNGARRVLWSGEFDMDELIRASRLVQAHAWVCKGDNAALLRAVRPTSCKA